MTDIEVVSQFNDQKMLTTHGDGLDFKLPKIDQHLSRPLVRSKAEKRKSPILPMVKKKSNGYHAQISPSKKSSGRQNDREQFALQIEEKLKKVLQNVNNGENIQEQQNEGIELDFEQAIMQNKQKIKQHKQKNTDRPNQLIKADNQQDKKIAKTKKSIKIIKNDNMYEKRVKEMSTENKYLQKKKEIIAQKHQALQKVKLLHNKQKQQNHVNKINIPLPVRYVTRPHQSPKASVPKPIPNEDIKSNNLFDNIHSFLQNPFKNREPSSIIHRKSLSKIKQLEQKIKALNEKLGVNELIDTKQTEQNIGIQNKTALDWKRIQYRKGANFKCHYDSSFQKEMDRVNSMQQKNEACLNQYLDHQKMLVQLSILQKNQHQSQRKTS